MTDYNTYDVGDLVQVTGAFTNAAGTAVDPTALAIWVRANAGNWSVYTYGTDAEVVRDSAGNYHCNVSILESGWYYYRWVATGTGQAAESGKFQVRAY